MHVSHDCTVCTYMYIIMINVPYVHIGTYGSKINKMLIQISVIALISFHEVHEIIGVMAHR